jgi:hypothetical protein
MKIDSVVLAFLFCLGINSYCIQAIARGNSFRTEFAVKEIDGTRVQATLFVTLECFENDCIWKQVVPDGCSSDGKKVYLREAKAEVYANKIKNRHGILDMSLEGRPDKGLTIKLEHDSTNSTTYRIEMNCPSIGAMSEGCKVTKLKGSFIGTFVGSGPAQQSYELIPHSFSYELANCTMFERK